MLSLDMSTNIQTCLEIIVNIWFGPGPGPGDFGRTRPRPRCFFGPGRSLLGDLLDYVELSKKISGLKTIFFCFVRGSACSQ